ncbi:GIN domain-containing protein [Geofilum sp. OHC36d9]|uniref:GIN domain-containing protein n=1 Tax=Geofilum sp. OHC36d9 TaxID=3458413 RepID=UPI004034B77F
MKKITALLYFTTLLSSCTYITDMKRTGDNKTISLSWNGATNIEIWAPCQIVLINSDTTAIQIEGMDFIVDGYELTQSEEKLTIEHKQTNWLQEEKMAEIRLYAPDFKTIIYNSPGHLLCRDTLIVNQFQIVVNGKGIFTTSDLTLKGNSLTLNVYGGINKSYHKLSGILSKASYTMEGGTDIDALNLKTQITNVNHKSYGNIYLNAEEQLNAKIYSTGNIYYTGQPNISFETIESTIMKASGQLLPYSEN